MTCPNANCFEFGEFRLDTVKMRLFRRNEIVPLTPKAIEVLILLVQNRGETVSRESLLETVWKDTFIEEGNINFNVSVLRKSLGQTAENGVQYIKTIPKRGYRFVADVREVPSGAPSPATSTVPGSVGRGRLLVYAAAAIVLLVAGFGGWRWRSVAVSADSPQRINSIAVLPLIELGGNERDQIV
ncbi:MAG TPA: transcriptional regulator, partial [Pyrinomonadaceae bacterium]|nr:transcriptional regulator [Pyrinomonadaceae bacterium]